MSFYSIKLKGLGNGLTDAFRGSGVLACDELAVYDNLSLSQMFRVSHLNARSRRPMLTPHGSAAFSYLPPREAILSSRRKGMSWGGLKKPISEGSTKGGYNKETVP